MDFPDMPVDDTAPVLARGQAGAHVVVTTADGRVFDLGRPDSRLFPLRRALYLHRRRKELHCG